MKRLGTRFLLISCLAVILVGCTPKFVKRWEFEDRFAKLSKVYPTKKAEDLFEKFPNGFEIEYDIGEKIEGEYIHHNFSLEGDPKTKEIKGIYVKSMTKIPIDEELARIPVVYTDKDGFQATDEQTLESSVKEIHFLFTKLSLDKSYLSSLKSNFLTENPVSGTYSIGYNNVENLTINNYLGVSKNTKIKLSIYGNPYFDKDNKYYTTIAVDLNNGKSFMERVIEK